MAETVSNRMAKDPFTLAVTDSLRVAVELALQKKIRHFPVVDGTGKLIGIVSDRDIKRALPSPLEHLDEEARERLLDETQISRIMTRDPIAVTPSTPVAEAIRTMLAKKISGLPVVEHGVLVGVFTETDALRAYLELLDASGA